MRTPRLPVGFPSEGSFQAAVRRVVSPDLPSARKVLQTAWPVVLTNLLQSLALTVDLIFVGQLGPTALAGTGVATQVFFLATTVGAGLAAGATALVARAFGQGDMAAAGRATSVSLMLAVVVSIPLAVFFFVFDGPILQSLGGDADVVDAGTIVLRVLAWGVPGNILMLAAAGALQGSGDTRPALVIGIGMNIVNVVLDDALIFGRLGAPAMGLEGAALATTIAYTLGGIAFLIMLVRGRRPLRAVHPGRDVPALARRVLRVGAPAGLEQLILTVGFTAYLVMILRFGPDALAAHQVGLRVQSFAFLPGFGFAAAASALVGQGLGRGRPDEAEKDGWMAIRLGLVMMVTLGLVMMLFARPLVGMFVTGADARRLGVEWVYALVLVMPALAVHFTAAGALRGAGDTKWPLAVSFIGLWGLRLPVAWLLSVTLGLGMVGIWAAYIFEYYVRAATTLVRFMRGKWKTTTV